MSQADLTLALGSHPTGLVSVPKYPFREQKEHFTFVSLFTRPEVITALNKVRAECNKVITMSLFHSNLSKHSRLEEFEQIQSQMFSQVGIQGTEPWHAGRGPGLHRGAWGSPGPTSQQEGRGALLSLELGLASSQARG